MTKKELIKKYRDIKELLYSYDYVMGTSYYDYETIAPRLSLNEKGKYLARMAVEYHKIYTSQEHVDVVNEIYNMRDTLPKNFKREIELEKKYLDQSIKLPKEMVEEEARLENDSYAAWLEAKEKNDFKIFAPYLKQMIDLRKRQANIYGLVNNNVYDTFLDEYEEGMRMTDLDQFFGELKTHIVPLLKKIEKSKVKIRTDFTTAKVNRIKQLDIANYALKQIGFDFKRGVVGETEHPFTQKISTNDVRVTTHVYENMFFSNIFSIVHEGGHALYDSNLDKKLGDTILNDGTSCAVHESQSRFYENIIGRSEEFITNIHKKVLSKLPKEYKDVTPHEMYLAANKAEPSLNRCDSDELTYSLHIMVRYEMEKLFMNNDIDVYELPKIWNKLYKEYLGVDVPNDTEGILQDVHWSGGSFGYFPSYALGNAIGVQIMNTMSKELDVFQLVKDKQIKVINKWLKEHVYIYGRLVGPAELVEIVTGEKLNPKYFIEYLESKFSKIYEL